MKQETTTFKFTCKNCKNSGLAACSRDFPFLHCPWYTDYNQDAHDCIYCRACGTVYDVTASIFGSIKKLMAQAPFGIDAVYDNTAIKRLMRIDNSLHPRLHTMYPLILEAMEEDGRLAADEDLTAQPTIEFLAECLKDKNHIVRMEAVIALKGFNNQQSMELLKKAMGDENWEVSEAAETVLEYLKSIGKTNEANESPEEPRKNPLETEQWQYFGYGRSRSSFDKIRRRKRRPKRLK